MISMNGSILPMSTLLPQPQRDALVAAARIGSRLDVEPGSHAPRTTAVDAAINAARSTNPQLYKEVK